MNFPDKTLLANFQKFEEKLITLRTAAEQANKQLQKGKITQEQYDALQSEIVAIEEVLKLLESQAAKCNTALLKISEVGDKLETTAASFESAMSQVQTTTGITSDDMSELNGETVNTMDALSDIVKEMAKKASSTNTRVVQLGEGILKIGTTTNSIKGGTEELNMAFGILANNNQASHRCSNRLDFQMGWETAPSRYRNIISPLGSNPTGREIY